MCEQFPGRRNEQTQGHSTCIAANHRGLETPDVRRRVTLAQAKLRKGTDCFSIPNHQRVNYSRD